MSITIGNTVYTLQPPEKKEAIKDMGRPRPQPGNAVITQFHELMGLFQAAGMGIYRGTKRIVPSSGDGEYRIDEQGGPATQHNMQYQAPGRTSRQRGSITYAAVISDRYISHFDQLGLTYIYQAFQDSFTEACNYEIKVTRRNKEAPQPPQPVPQRKERNYDELNKEILRLERRINKANSTIRRGTKIVSNIEKTIAKTLERAVKEEGPKVIAKKIPLVSFFVGLFCAAERIAEGDLRKALAEFTSGLAGDFPGFGTAISAMIDVDLLTNDVRELLETESAHEKLAQREIEAAKREEETLQQRLSELRGDSRCYGEGNTALFDESPLMLKGDITKIVIHHGNMIDGIQFFYGKTPGGHHGGHGGKKEEFVLQHGERIVKISGRAGRVIDSLTFHLNSGRSKTFGGSGGNPFSFTFREHFSLGAIKGFSKESSSSSGGINIGPIWAGPSAGPCLPSIGFIPKFFHASTYAQILGGGDLYHIWLEQMAKLNPIFEVRRIQEGECYRSETASGIRTQFSKSASRASPYVDLCLETPQGKTPNERLEVNFWHGTNKSLGTLEEQVVVTSNREAIPIAFSEQANNLLGRVERRGGARAESKSR